MAPTLHGKDPVIAPGSLVLVGLPGAISAHFREFCGDFDSKTRLVSSRVFEMLIPNAATGHWSEWLHREPYR